MGGTSPLPTFPPEAGGSAVDHAPVMCARLPRQAGGAQTPFRLGLFNRHPSNSPFMHSKTPSGPILPPAITADQKNDNNSCCETKAKQRQWRGRGVGEVRLKSSSEKEKKAPWSEKGERDHSDIQRPLLLTLQLGIHLSGKPSSSPSGENLPQKGCRDKGTEAFVLGSQERMTPHRLQRETP